MERKKLEKIAAYAMEFNWNHFTITNLCFIISLKMLFFQHSFGKFHKLKKMRVFFSTDCSTFLIHVDCWVI